MLKKQARNYNAPAVFFSSLLINLASLSKWIFLFVDSVRNSLKILNVVFMILLSLFINTNAFNELQLQKDICNIKYYGFIIIRNKIK